MADKPTGRITIHVKGHEASHVLDDDRLREMAKDALKPLRIVHGGGWGFVATVDVDE